MFVVVLTDVIFEVDDGHVAAHKVLLMAGCEMMNAMFSNSFLESSADVVSSSSPPFPSSRLWPGLSYLAYCQCHNHRSRGARHGNAGVRVTTKSHPTFRVDFPVDALTGELGGDP